MLITFPENSTIGTTECADFAITDDELAETMESFTVTGSGGNFVGGQDSTQVTIQDNDGETIIFRFLLGHTSLNEQGKASQEEMHED